MYYIKMTFTPLDKTRVEDEDYIDEAEHILWSYLGSLLRNGQIYENNLIYKDGVFYAYFLMPELDSLDEKYCNEYALREWAGVKADFQTETEILGNESAEYDVCDCKEPSWYILYANKAYNTSPVICGDCFGMIPDYKFNHLDIPKGTETALGWQKDYNLIDKLWINSRFDRFTYRQMSDPKSRLSVDGIAICAVYEKVLGKPFYYFLFCTNETRKHRKVCPKCGGDWGLDKEIGYIANKCDKCRLVSL